MPLAVIKDQMNDLILADWFGIICIIIIIACLTILTINKKLRENIVLKIVSVIGLIILCAAIIPTHSLRIRIKHLKETTDSDTTQFMASSFITYGGWWVLLVLLVTCYLLVTWLVTKFQNRKHN